MNCEAKFIGIVGGPCSGKSSVCKILSKVTGYKIIDSLDNLGSETEPMRGLILDSLPNSYLNYLELKQKGISITHLGSLNNIIFLIMN